MKVKKELQTLRGVGDVLAKRFIDAGFETFEKVAAASEEALQAIKGINQRAIPSIIAQAKEFTENAKERTKRIESLKSSAAAMKETVQGVAVDVRDRFKEELTGKTARKVEKELQKLTTSLGKVEAKLETKSKKAGKGLAKAEKRLAGLAEKGLKDVGRSLKKARKSLKRVYA